jgi:hypothetical protein
MTTIQCSIYHRRSSLVVVATVRKRSHGCVYLLRYSSCSGTVCRSNNAVVAIAPDVVVSEAALITIGYLSPELIQTCSLVTSN